MFMNFCNLLLWQIYHYGNTSWVLHLHYSYMAQLAMKEIIFNKLWKLFELKFRSSTSWKVHTAQRHSWSHKKHYTLHKFISVFIIKSLLNVNLNIWSAFISNVVCLGKILINWYKYSGSYLMPRILWYG